MRQKYWIWVVGLFFCGLIAWVVVASYVRASGVMKVDTAELIKVREK